MNNNNNNNNGSVGVLPRFVTKYDVSNPNDFKQGLYISYLCSRSWSPWQVQAGMLLSSRKDSKHYEFSTVIITVPRQCGKTTLVFDVAMGRVGTMSDYRGAFTAQTGHVVTERFMERTSEINSNSYLNDVFTCRRSAGTERISRRESYLKAFPPVDGALRGSALDLVIVDEAQEHDEITGLGLDTTINPVFTTRPRRQMIITGTAGTDQNGHYLKKYIDLAKSGEKGFALLEYGAMDGENTDDEEIWYLRHPGLASGLTDIEAMRVQRSSMGHNAFAREYMNVWTSTETAVIDPNKWRKCQKTDTKVDNKHRVCFAVDITPNRSASCIAVAGKGRKVQIVASKPGTDWVQEEITRLALKYNAPVVCDYKGASGTLYDALKLAEKVQLIDVRPQDVANACADFLDSINREEVNIKPHSDLDVAITNASFRSLGDGVAWNRKGIEANISPLIAITNALWGYAHLPPLPLAPVPF